jgi:DNA-directed RNA polymerase specialized sigma24 family protein
MAFRDLPRKTSCRKSSCPSPPVSRSSRDVRRTEHFAAGYGRWYSVERPTTGGSLSAQVSTTSLDLLTIPANTVEADDVQAEQQAFEELRIRAMELARQSCTENSWQMFWQTVVEGRPTADVAKDFGVSAAAVRMARGRVLNLLREFLVDDVTMPGRLDPA